MLNELESPDILLALIAILVLLIIWQYYKMQVMAGRILAVDIFDRSSVRLYVYATCSGEHTCPNCSSTPADPPAQPWPKRRGRSSTCL